MGVAWYRNWRIHLLFFLHVGLRSSETHRSCLPEHGWLCVSKWDSPPPGRVWRLLCPCQGSHKKL